jgi:signal transduction histidine kinase
MRLTVGATAVVAVALIIASAALVGMLEATLVERERTAAAEHADEIAIQIASMPGEPPAFAAGEPDEVFTQVLDQSGAVVAASPNLIGRRALTALRPGETTRVATPLDESEFVVAAAGSVTARGPRTVLVGRSLSYSEESGLAVIGLLAAGLPLLLVVVSLTTWKVVGRALAPVEAIRTEVDEISATQLHRRVPQPPGHDEIVRLAATMNRMLARLEDAQARRRRFTSDAGHELRSPVAGLRQHAEVAAAHPNATSVPELAAVVLAETKRVQDLVEDLLLLSTADEGRRLAERPVDLDDLVLEQAAKLRTASVPSIDTSAVSGGRVRGDPDRLQRVVCNLLENAVRHARTTVVVSLRVEGPFVVLDVDDDGTGIPASHRERVFERFVRLDEARSRDKGGTGLGLAIVAETVAAHRGTVLATDRPGGGARLRVRLPTLVD